MNCYTCAQEGDTREAVAVCAVCGMGLCMEHAFERTVSHGKHPPGPAGVGTATTMYIFCERCAKERAVAT